MPTDSEPTPPSVYGPPVWPSFETVAALLERWAREHAAAMTLEVAGRSRAGRPVYVARLTDPTADAATKEHALITGLHSGVERSGTTAILCLMEWLLSGDAAAREVLRHQVLVCVPVAHPDGYIQGQHGSVYGDWTLAGPRQPESAPEAVAIQRLMDQYQPELHADLHGMSLGFARYTMLENSANSYSNLALRCYHPEIVRLMDEAALAEGFPSDHQESDAERTFWGPDLEPMAEKLWVGRSQVYAAVYAYAHYHTLLSASEVCWERSGLLRHARLLRVGNGVWPGEFYPGYPTRVVLSNHYHLLTAYGQTAAARRRSRVELWNKLPQLSLAMNDPMVEGKIICVGATTPAAAARWVRDKTLRGFAETADGLLGSNAEPIRRFVAGWPAGQNHPEAWFWTVGGGGKPEAASPIEHGLALRLRLFDAQARVTDLRLNGQPLTLSETDGYVSWVARGITYVQVNLPPATTARQELFVVTCAYEPGIRRERWQGWRQ